MHLVGFEDKPPSWTIYGMADVYTGLCTSYAITQALFQREKTGKGQFVDSAMLDAMISLNERMVMLYTMTGEEPHRGRLKHLYPRGAFKCKNGYLAMNVPDDLVWSRLCKSMEREDLIDNVKSKTGTARAANSDFLGPIIEEWLSKKTRDEAEKILNENGVPVGSVYTAKDIFESEQVKARRALIDIEDPDVGRYQFARGPVMLSGAPEIETNPAPDLGQHTHEVLSSILGYSDEQINELINSNTIGIKP